MAVRESEPFPTEAIMAGVDWHDATMLEQLGELRRGHRELSDRLMGTVTPSDIRIGGPAVRHVIERAEPSWYIGPLPEATVGVEYWASDGETVVRLAKERNDDATRDRAGLLARQVLGKGNWFPGTEERRIAKIAELVAAESTLIVDVMPLPEESDKQIAEHLRHDMEQVGKRLWLHDETLSSIDRDEVLASADWLAHSQYAWEFMSRAARATALTEQDAARIAHESWQVQADATPTLAEYLEPAQRAVDKWFVEMAGRLEIVRLAQLVTVNGERIRPAGRRDTV